MNRSQRILGGIGVVGAILGIAMIVQPQLAGYLTTRRLLVSVIGVLALVQTVRIVNARRSIHVTRAETPTPERFVRMPTPGGVFEEPLSAIDETRGIDALRRKRELREQLAEAAITVLAHREGSSHRHAREQLEAGAWTDDPYAAAFLGDVQAPELRWRERVRLKLRRESPFQWKARRTMDAIARAGALNGDRSS